MKIAAPYTALSWNSKESALYFDNVVPIMPLAELVLDAVKSVGLGAGEELVFAQSDEFYKGIMPDYWNLDRSSYYALNNALFYNGLIRYFAKHPDEKSVFIEKNGLNALREIEDTISLPENDLWVRYRKLIADWNLQQFVSDGLAPGGTDRDVLSLIFQSLSLVDVTKLSWAEIIAFREDREARKALLNFRKFAVDSFQDLSHSQIVEELERLKLNYESAAKKHGFELTKQSLTTLLSSKLLAGGGLATFLATSAGMGLGATAVAATPVVMELGKFAIELSGRKHAIAEFQANNPVSYISMVEDKLSAKKK